MAVETEGTAVNPCYELFVNAPLCMFFGFCPVVSLVLCDKGEFCGGTWHVHRLWKPEFCHCIALFNCVPCILSWGIMILVTQGMEHNILFGIGLAVLFCCICACCFSSEFCNCCFDNFPVYRTKPDEALPLAHASSFLIKGLCPFGGELKKAEELRSQGMQTTGTGCLWRFDPWEQKHEKEDSALTNSANIAPKLDQAVEAVTSVAKGALAKMAKKKK